jgi:hypothetical protein
MTDDHTHQGDDVHSVELAEREANGGWQPIETAPEIPWKQILAWPILAWPVLAKSRDTRVGSCSVSFAKMTGATHWMPLPAAPTEGKHLTPPKE